MFTFRLALLFAIVVAIAFADDKYCHNDGLPIKEGETGPAGKGCHRVTCNKAPNGISGVGCGVFQPAPGCRVGEYDNSKRYPACCPQHICD